MASTSEPRHRHADYTVACICPMGVELAPVEAMLDRIHPLLPVSRDQNAYTLGEIGGHNVVVAIMPEIGNNAAATTATQLLNNFPSIRFGLLVGIGGGVPGEADIRLGEVVVSQPTATYGGVVQYDMGKREEGEEGGKFRRTGLLNKPPAVLSTNVRKLDSQHRRLGHNLSRCISAMLQKYPTMQADYSFPASERDQLFLPTYTHQFGPTCVNCDSSCTVPRSDRPNNEPKIHYGTIGSANVVIKDAILRDLLYQDLQILCVEMEAAGLMNDFPCLVVRGICDYADSHENKNWQPYAAAVAAAYMRDLLLIIPVQEVTQTGSPVKSNVSPFSLGLHLTEAPVIDSTLFVGRLPDLERMQEILQPQNLSQEHRRLVLGGLGGVGKTQLAIAYARRHRHAYDSIFWLNAMSEVHLKQSLRLMAQRMLEVEKYQGMDDEQILLHVSRWLLNPMNTRWLVIFDNYDEPSSYDIKKYCAHGPHGSVIVTTRLPDQVAGRPLLVRPLEDIEHSLEILETRSKRDHVKTDLEARRLAQRMQGLPLALATAGSYLSKSNWTFGQYLQEYERRWNISPRRSPQLHEYQDRTLYTTWDISYTRLNEKDADAAQMLKLLAYFDNQNIWFDLIHAGVSDEVPDWLVTIAIDSAEFDSVMGRLVEYCFLQSTTQSYNMHSCVHDWTLAGLNQNIDLSSYRYAIGCVANSIINEDSRSLSQIQYSQLALHAIRLTHTKFEDIMETVLVNQFSEAGIVITLLQQQAQLGAAHLLCVRFLSGYEQLWGLEALPTLDVVNTLGSIYDDQGKLNDAEQMYKRALAGREKIIGPENISTLNIVNNLSIVYSKQNKLNQAEQMYTRALNGYEKLLGPEHISTLNTVNNLGILYQDQGKLDQAEQMYMRALNGREKLLGPEHISTLKTVNNLGILYQDQGKLDQAEQMYTHALNGFKSCLGPCHQSTQKVANLPSELRRQQHIN